MIKIDDLARLYKPAYFKSQSKSIAIREPQKGANTLKEVTFTFTGSMICISPDFLEDSVEIYVKPCSGVSFRHICDGIFLLEQEDKKYIIWVELKSGYKDVCKKAIDQLATSYVKTKSHLMNFSTFVPDEYRELGIIVSFPPKAEDLTDADNNPMVMANKLRNVGASTPSYRNLYHKALCANQEVVMKGIDFGFHTLPLVPQISMTKLYVKHQPVTTENAVIDLNQILQQVPE